MKLGRYLGNGNDKKVCVLGNEEYTGNRHANTKPRRDEESYLEEEAVVVSLHVSSFPVMIMIMIEAIWRR